MTARAPLPPKREPSRTPGGAPRPPLPSLPAGRHWLASCDGVTARDVVCRHGAASPAQCGQTAHARVGLLLAGVFQARGTLGDAVLAPQALLTSNAGERYEFRHVDDGGDRSLVFELDERALAASFRRAFGLAPRAYRALRA